MVLPAPAPEARVAVTGLCLPLILLSGRKRSPSLAMANRTRGIGNIDPSRLRGQRSLVGELNSFEFKRGVNPKSRLTCVACTLSTAHRGIPRTRRTWRGPSRWTWRPRAAGCERWAGSTASWGRAPPTRRSTPKYARKQMRRDATMPSGIDFWGVSTSSPEGNNTD